MTWTTICTTRCCQSNPIESNRIQSNPIQSNPYDWPNLWIILNLNLNQDSAEREGLGSSRKSKAAQRSSSQNIKPLQKPSFSSTTTTPPTTSELTAGRKGRDKERGNESTRPPRGGTSTTQTRTHGECCELMMSCTSSSSCLMTDGLCAVFAVERGGKERRGRGRGRGSGKRGGMTK